MSTQQREEWMKKAGEISVDLHREIVRELVYQLSRDNQIAAMSKFSARRLVPGPRARNNLMQCIRQHVESITLIEAFEVTLSDRDVSGESVITFTPRR